MESLDVKLFSLNVNGLGDTIKRQAVFDKLRKKGPGIFLLQETHSTIQTEEKWKTQWGSNNITFCHGKPPYCV